MNQSQSNLVKQAEKIVETYSRKKRTNEVTKIYNLIIAVISLCAAAAIIYLLR